jgi:hypothetical protein
MKVGTTPVSSITTKDAIQNQKSPLQSIRILDLEIARNTPESQVWASGPVTTFIPRFYLGEEYRFEDHDSSLFCALKRKTRVEHFQLARGPAKKGVQQFFSRDARVLFGDIPISGNGAEQARILPARYLRPDALTMLTMSPWLRT